MTTDGTTFAPAPVRAANDYQLVVSGADTFGQSGLFIRRVEQPSASNIYSGSITKYFSTQPQNFYGTYQALVKRDGDWVPADSSSFKITVLPGNLTVIWTLQESAPAATYGVSCDYLEDPNDEYTRRQEIFPILYTESWTYVSVNDQAQRNYITEYYGGTSRTLSLKVGYNDGATVLSLLEGEQLANGALYGDISSNEIITADNFSWSMSTVSGKTYDSSAIYSSVVGNVVSLMFDQPLEAGELYILKCYSALDGRVYGQFIIDNTASSGGINLSSLWILCVALGGLLILVSVSLFFVPLIILKVNENRVYQENLRVAKMKNPDAHVDKGGNWWQRLKTKFKKMGKNTAKEEAPKKPQLENASTEKKFTDMIRQNREKREYMEEHGISSEQVEALQKQQAELREAEKHSFAFLRDDDDDEIASLYEEKEEAPTIETDSYVQDGVTFAKLDSMKGQSDSYPPINTVNHDQEHGHNPADADGDKDANE